MPTAPTAAELAARDYVRAGWRIVPVPRGSKNPGLEGWPSNDYTPDDIGAGNVGVILGPVSGDLVDIDIDSRAALELADYFLPPTLSFGHASKPRSHLLYYAPGVRKQSLKFALGDGTVECIEVMAQNASDNNCSHQTVFPGSVWRSKDGKREEPVEWDAGCKHDAPQPVNGSELLWAVQRLTVACIIADGWGEGAGRNVKTMGYAAGLLGMGWDPDDVRDLLAAVREYAGDDVEQNRKNEGAVERTITAFENGVKTAGFGSLVQEGIVDQSVIRSIERHGKTPTQRARELKLAKTKKGKGILERMHREARETDLLTSIGDDIAALGNTRARDANPSVLPARVGREVLPGLVEQDANESIFGRQAKMSEPREPIKYLCEGLRIAPGKVSTIGGYSGTGKGPFANLFALCVASGRDLLGMPVMRSKVVFLDFETGPLVELRLHRIAHALNLSLAELEKDGWLTVIHARGPLDEEYLEALHVAIEHDDVGLVCIDSYTSAVPGDQNDASIADVAFALGQMSAALGTTIVVTTHERKAQAGKRAGDLEMVSGHNALTAAMQTAISLTRPDDTDKALIEVRCARAPEEAFETFRIRWEDVSRPHERETRGALLKAEKWGLRAVQEEIAAFERELSPAEMTTAVTHAQSEIIAHMQTHYPESLQAWVTELLGSNKRAKDYAIRRTAIRELIRSGRLLANHHWRQPPAGMKTKQLVWLQGKNAQLGVVQS